MNDHARRTLDSLSERCIRGLYLAVFALALSLAALAASLAPLTANAQVVERARSPQECALIADMALTAHALSSHSIEPGTAASVMRAVYAAALGGPEGARWRGIMERVMRSARAGAAQGMASLAFGEGVGNTCMLTAGDLDAMLGVAL